MLDIERSIATARSPKEASALFSRTEPEPRSHTDVLEVTRVDDGPVTVASTYALQSTPTTGKSDGTLAVADLEPPAKIEMDIVLGPMAPHLTFRFEPTDNGTKVTRRVQVKAPGPMKIIPFVMRRMIARRSDVFLANLKEQLESTRPGA